jgi:transposase
LAEFGIVAAQGDAGVTELLAIVADEQDTRLTLIGSIEKRIKTQHRSNEVSQRVETIPGIGFLGATAIVATAADPTIFRSGRDFAAWIGLVPRQDSTGGKQKLGPISKQGDRYLRRILIVGAIAVLRRAQENPGKYPWLTQLLGRRPFKVVAVALANKMARTAWALMALVGRYHAANLLGTEMKFNLVRACDPVCAATGWRRSGAQFRSHQGSPRQSCQRQPREENRL